MKTAPEYPWGGCLLRLNASGDNRPGAQGKLTLRARLHIPVSFRAVPERHDSMIRDTHRRRNAICAHLLPGQSHMFGAHPRSPVGSARRDTRIAPRPRRPDLRCARGGVQPGRAAARLRQLGRTARLWDGKAAGALHRWCPGRKLAGLTVLTLRQAISIECRYGRRTLVSWPG